MGEKVKVMPLEVHNIKQKTKVTDQLQQIAAVLSSIEQLLKKMEGSKNG